MSSNLEIIPVNKYESGWFADTLFSGFKIRAVLAESRDVIAMIQSVSRLRSKLSREVGEEGEDWIIHYNQMLSKNELYLHNSGKLLLWKLQDKERFIELFEYVEQHTDDPKVIEEYRNEQERLKLPRPAPDE